MVKIYSKQEPELLLHIVYFLRDRMQSDSDIDEITPIEENLQVICVRWSKGRTAQPHYHLDRKEVNVPFKIQESFVVIGGMLRIWLYDIDGTRIAGYVLDAGDMFITLRGGHSVEAMSEKTIWYEHKTPNYLGQKKDKTFI